MLVLIHFTTGLFLGNQYISLRAGALSMLVAFWFDGGLFTLPTAAVFWILLELGAAEHSTGFNWAKRA